MSYIYIYVYIYIYDMICQLVTIYMCIATTVCFDKSAFELFAAVFEIHTFFSMYKEAPAAPAARVAPEVDLRGPGGGGGQPKSQ